MKKVLYSLLAVCTLALVFVSCSNDIEINRGTHAQKPETALAGEVSGIWTQYNSDCTEVVATASGSLVFTASDKAYIGKVESKCEGIAALNNLSGPINVTWSNEDIKFYAISTSNLPLNGYKYTNGTTCARLTKTVKVGKKQTTFIYEFVGKK